MEKLHFVAPASPSLFLLETIFGQKSSNNSSFQGRPASPGKSVKNVSKKNFLLSSKDANSDWKKALGKAKRT